MSPKVGIVYADEMSQWRDFVVTHLTTCLAGDVKFIQYTDVDYVPKKGANTLSSKSSNVAVLIVMISPNFVDTLEDTRTLNFRSLSPKTQMILFFCGLAKTHLDNSEVRNRFNDFDSITKFDHEECKEILETSINICLKYASVDSSGEEEKIQFIKKLSRKLQSKRFSMFPKYLQCEQQTTMTLVFDEALAHGDDVSVEFEFTGAREGQRVRAESVAPNVFTFESPTDLSPGQGLVKILVNNKLFGSHPVRVKSFEGQIVLTLTQMYISFFDSLLNFIDKLPQPTNQINLDKILAKSTDGQNPPQAFFGHDRSDEFELPTLLHLAGKYKLKEFYQSLMKINGAKDAEQLRNTSGYTAEDLVKSSSVTKAQDSIQRIRNPNEPTIIKPPSDMSYFPESQRELVDIMNKVKKGELSQEDADNLYKYWRLKNEAEITPKIKQWQTSPQKKPKLKPTETKISNPITFLKNKADRASSTSNTSRNSTTSIISQVSTSGFESCGVGNQKIKFSFMPATECDTILEAHNESLVRNNPQSFVKSQTRLDTKHNLDSNNIIVNNSLNSSSSNNKNNNSDNSVTNINKNNTLQSIYANFDTSLTKQPPGSSVGLPKKPTPKDNDQKDTASNLTNETTKIPVNTNPIQDLSTNDQHYLCMARNTQSCFHLSPTSSDTAELSKSCHKSRNVPMVAHNSMIDELKSKQKVVPQLKLKPFISNLDSVEDTSQCYENVTRNAGPKPVPHKPEKNPNKFSGTEQHIKN